MPSRHVQKENFDHVCDIVLNRDDSSDWKKAVMAGGATDIGSLLSLTEEQTKSLTDTDNNPLSHNDRNLSHIFAAYVTWRNLSDDPINNNWRGISRDMFEHFRITEFLNMCGPAPMYAQTRRPRSPYTPRTSYTPVDNFKRGIKRDPTYFPTLKDERYNDTWHRSFAAQARAQDVHNVLDPNYKPSTTEAKDLFLEQQKYVYAVFEAKLQTDMGKKFVRDHESDFDAQEIYRKLVAHHTKSTKASMDSANLLSYITSARLGDGEWKGSTCGFIVHWQDNVRKYEKQVPDTDHFSDGQKRTMLQNAVAKIRDLRAVKEAADMERTRTGKELTYDEYVTLLLSNATSYDEQFKDKVRSKRTVYFHDFHQDDDDGAQFDHDYDDNDLYDVDTPIDVIQANTHNMSTNNRTDRVRMPRERWMQLTPEQRQLWDKLNDKAKAIILGISSSGTKPTGSSPPKKDPPRRDINLHEMSALDFLQIFAAETEGDTPTDSNEEEFFDANDVPEEPNDTQILINAAKTGKRLDPADIRRVMSTTSTRYKGGLGGTGKDPGKKREANTAQVTYKVTTSAQSPTHSLIDRGANGGIAGTDVRVIFKTQRLVDVQGIDNHQMCDVGIGTVGGVVQTQKGPVIAIFHQYALHGKGTSIHSCAQMEAYKLDVNDKSIHAGGYQRIKTPDGYTIPLAIRNGLARLKLRPYTDKEWDDLPHVFMTGETQWDPSVLDHDPEEHMDWEQDLADLEANPHTNLFDQFGNYRQRVTVQYASYLQHTTDDELEDYIDRCVFHAHSAALERETKADDDPEPFFFNAFQHEQADSDEPGEIHSDDIEENQDARKVNTKAPDYEKLRPMFGWMSPSIIQRTFEMTTQLARIPMGTWLKKAFQSPNPALNVFRRNEPVATDVFYSDVPAIDNGSTACSIFVGTRSMVTDAYGIKSDKEFVNTLEDNIRQRGAMNKLVSDRAQVNIGQKALDILRALFIGSWQSEPHQQHQNPAERRIQTVKHTANTIMDRTGAPAFTWLLCIIYVCFLLNRTYCPETKQVPLNFLLGTTVDISMILRFHFWQKVYYAKHENGFPSESKEGVGRIVGISENVGNALTWMVLTDETQKVIYRSQVRPFDASNTNLRAESMLGGEEGPPKNSDPIIKSRGDSVLDGNSKHDSEGNSLEEAEDIPVTTSAPVFDPEDLVGRTVLLDEQPDGQRFRARIVKLVDDHESKLEENPTRLKFLCSINDGKAEELITYTKMLDYIARDQESDVVWKFRRIVSHQGPMSKHDKMYMGSRWNIQIEWENGEITTEPLNTIAADDPVTCAIYAKEKGLLHLEGWKRFKGIARRQKKFERMVNQAKLRSYNTAPRYKYGFEVARDYNHAMRLDERNGNKRWKEAIDTEMKQIDEYETFNDHGLAKDRKPPDGYKKIRVHLVFDIKHDGRHKARLVADGHLTDVPLESVYSGVVSLRGFRLVIFLAELNGLETWSTDIGNAYLESFTREKVYIVAGPEFGDREGHILIIRKALYGLRTSGKMWNERFAECLKEMGFFQSKAEPEIWMRRNGDIYEYVATYVDDLAMALVKPQEFIDKLEKHFKFKLKGTGPIEFHLGMDFYRDGDGTLCMAPKKYIEKLVANYERTFGESPKQTVSAPLEKGDHPELDTSELLEKAGIEQYQSLIGALQWVISIGRFDVHTAVMTLSGFRAAPRRGHLDRAKRIVGYLSKMRNAAIRVRTEEPDYSDLPEQDFDWSKSVYGGDLKELIPEDAPEPLGKFVTLTHYVDANLMHDMMTGKSVTGILHLLNKTPIDWYSKKQATVETATYGSEFVAARTCVEQIIDLRLTLRYLGVNIRSKSYMFGDNQSVVNSSMQVQSRLHKRHTILSYHRVREAIASGMVGFYHIPGVSNPADIVSKHWGYQAIWPLLRPLLFWSGDTADSELPKRD